jgi:hypothetical protein
LSALGIFLVNTSAPEVVTVTVVVTGIATVEMEGLMVIVTVRTLPVFEVTKTVAVFEAVTVEVTVTVPLLISKKRLKATHPLRRSLL